MMENIKDSKSRRLAIQKRRKKQKSLSAAFWEYKNEWLAQSSASFACLPHRRSVFSCKCKKLDSWVSFGQILCAKFHHCAFNVLVSHGDCNSTIVARLADQFTYDPFVREIGHIRTRLTQQIQKRTWRKKKKSFGKLSKISCRKHSIIQYHS